MPRQKSPILILQVLAWFWLASPAFPQAGAVDSPLLARIRALPGVVEAKQTRFDGALFREAYEVMIEEPLDHGVPEGEKFRQKFFLCHAAFDKPVLLETEGYAARGARAGELVRLLGANLVVIEHRFFGKSVPSETRWEYLTVRQSADDLHAIVSALKTLYPGKWISSGTSKGGQTALFYKSLYPGDVAACVPYSAPINIAPEDPRLYEFLRRVGDETTRKRITEYQIAMFDRETEILPLVGELAAKRKWEFSMGLAEAYEYGVLEYPFAFWQYGTMSPAEIPAPDAPAEALFEHLNKTNAVFFYSDQGRRTFEPFQYQAFTEIGYYNYDIAAFKGHMKALKDPSNRILCPEGAQIVYRPQTMQEVYRFLQYEGDGIAYIYGELDPWSATAVPLIGRTDAIQIVVKGGHHGVRIADFSPEQRDRFLSCLERWLDVKLAR